MDRLSEATEAYRDALSLDPFAPDIHANLSLIWLKRGHLSKALRYSRRAVELAPREAKLHFDLGVLCTLRHPERAFIEYKRLLRLDRRLAELLWVRINTPKRLR